MIMEHSSQLGWSERLELNDRESPECIAGVLSGSIEFAKRVSRYLHFSYIKDYENSAGLF